MFCSKLSLFEISYGNINKCRKVVSSASEVCECSKIGNKNVNIKWQNEEVMQMVKS